MIKKLTFTQRIAAGFGVTLFLGLVIGIVSILALRSVTASQNAVAFTHLSDVITAKNLMTLAQQNVAITRGFLLTRDRLFLEDLQLADATFSEALAELKKRAQDQTLIRKIEDARFAHARALSKALVMRKRKVGVKKVSAYYNDRVMHEFDGLERAITNFVNDRQAKLVEARTASVQAYSRAIRLICFLAFAAFALAASLAYFLTRQLGKIHESAEKAVVARDEMLAAVSHDLRNPLSSIMMGLRIILRKSKAEASTDTKLVSTLSQAADRMNRLTQDLLDVTKFKEGHFRIEPTAVKPLELVETARSMMEPLALESKVALNTQCLEPIEEVWCDRERVLQVLSNLMVNAFKFTSEGGTVRLEVQQNGSETVFSVIDNGRGIEASSLDRVFDRYWRASEKARGGTGLGLAIAKSIVVSHGGRIWVESKVGRGSTFRFSIPNSSLKPELDPVSMSSGLKREMHKEAASSSDQLM